jgi:hypothetical protein
LLPEVVVDSLAVPDPSAASDPESPEELEELSPESVPLLFPDPLEPDPDPDPLEPEPNPKPLEPEPFEPLEPEPEPD